MWVRVEGQLSFNSSLSQVDAAVMGYGIAYVPENIVEENLRSGVLQTVIEDWSEPFTGYHLYYPSRRQMSPAMALVVGCIEASELNASNKYRT